MIHMVAQVRWALDELGIKVPWNEHGPVCELDVPCNGASARIRHEFSAASARLFITTILINPASAEPEVISSKLSTITPTVGARPFVSESGYLACAEVLEVLPGDATPLFMGRLLDRATERMMQLAEAVEVLPKT
jgi:hypothetical protein